MYYVYVMSDENGKLYKGFTNNLNRRLQEHNSGHTITTSKMKRPLKIEYYEELENLSEALSRERYFKTATGRRFLKKVLGP